MLSPGTPVRREQRGNRVLPALANGRNPGTNLRDEVIVPVQPDQPREKPDPVNGILHDLLWPIWRPNLQFLHSLDPSLTLWKQSQSVRRRNEQSPGQQRHLFRNRVGAGVEGRLGNSFFSRVDRALPRGFAVLQREALGDCGLEIIDPCGFDDDGYVLWPEHHFGAQVRATPAIIVLVREGPLGSGDLGYL